MSADQELEPSSVLTSEALRAAALAASTRRGVFVSRKRIMLRWSTWLLWGWLLPLVGLATVLAALLAFASIAFFGTSKVFDTSQIWLAEQLGLPKTKMASSPFDSKADYNSSTLPDFNTTPYVVPQLQIERDYSREEQINAAIPEAPIAPVISTVPLTVPNPSSPPKPLGAQP